MLISKKHSPFAITALLLSFSGFASANSLSLSIAGSFGSSVTQTQLTSPSAAWSLSFNFDSQPMPSNAGADGFDAPFSHFSYDLAGSSIAVSPESVRFYGASNGGLFTVFFGPESGHDSNGMFIPEFIFSGAQLFSGSMQSPMFMTGSFPVSEFLYTDNSNYEDQLNPGSTVTLSSASTATPEPASLALFALAAFLAGSRSFFMRAKRLS